MGTLNKFRGWLANPGKWDEKRNPGDVQRESSSMRTQEKLKNKAKWMPKPTPKNPGEVQRDYASKQSMKTQTNKAKWKKGFIKTPSLGGWKANPSPYSKKSYSSPGNPHKKSYSSKGNPHKNYPSGGNSPTSIARKLKKLGTSFL